VEGDVVLSVRDVTKTFGPVRAVDELSFTVRRGTITGLLGRNGAGKTTTLRMINGIFLPDSGTIELFGTTDAAAARDRVGYLPEERGLYRKMRVLEQLLFLAAIKGRRPADARPSAERWLQRFDLWDKRGVLVKNLSHGDQRRIEVAMALAEKPRLLLLDEPAAGLSSAETQDLTEKVRAVYARFLEERLPDGRDFHVRRLRRAVAAALSSAPPGRFMALHDVPFRVRNDYLSSLEEQGVRDQYSAFKGALNPQQSATGANQLAELDSGLDIIQEAFTDYQTAVANGQSNSTAFSNMSQVLNQANPAATWARGRKQNLKD
jgi:ABC-type Na+ transport system ATPase subunit NatA